jgi:hypothetical protein
MTHPIILDACRKHHVTPEEFFGAGRARFLTRCRKEAARNLRAKGCSWRVMSRILKRSRETVRYWGDLKIRQNRRAYMLRRWHDVYKHQRVAA